MKTQTLSLSISKQDVTAFEEAINKAFTQKGHDLPNNLLRYEEPPPGSFGFGEGVIKFAADAWSELIKVPEAVKILAQGLADFMRKKRGSVVVRIDKEGGKVMEMKLSGDMTAEEVEAFTRMVSADFNPE